MNRLEEYPQEHHTPNFDVYENVWIMQDNKPTEMVIFAVVVSMSHNKRGQDVHYQLVRQICGTGWGNNEGIRRDEASMFTSKEDLLASL